LMGCISGGVITKCIGLRSAVFAGILILIAGGNKNRSITNR
jgi:hypothetical protein